MTPLLDGRILVTGGEDATGVIASAEVYDPRADRWTSVGDLNAARHRHAAALLKDGRVLVTGGSSAAGPLASSEIFDPATGTFTQLADMNAPRYWGTLTRLRDGTVLAIGGETGSGYATAVDKFDPADGSWKAVAPLPIGHARHIALRLPTDDVLISGGYDSNGLSGATHIYRSDTDTWEDIGSLATPRYKHSALLRPDGSIIVAAGYGSPGYLSSTEILPAGATAFIPGPALNRSRGYHTSLGLPNGSLLLVGGDGMSSVEEVRPDGTVLDLPSLPTARTWAAVSLLSDGQVMVTGGSGTGADTRSHTLAQTEIAGTSLSLSHTRSGHTLTALTDGSLLLVGGTDGPFAAGSSDVLRWSESNGWREASALPGPLAGALTGHSSSLLPDGSVLVVGGRVGDTVVPETWEWVKGPDCWQAAAALPAPLTDHASLALADGRVLVLGGHDGSTVVATAAIYDRTSNDWTAAEPLPSPLSGLALTRLDDGRVLATGGTDDNGYQSNFAGIFDPDTGAWIATGPLNVARTGHLLVPLIGGRVLATGDDELDGSTDNDDEFWDPATDTWTRTTGSSLRRGGSRATLPDGNVLLVGGGVDEVEWVNSRDGSRHLSGWNVGIRSGMAAAPDGTGGVIVIGGTDSGTPMADGWRFRKVLPGGMSESTMPTPLLENLPLGAEPGARITFEIPNLADFPESGSGMMNDAATDLPQVSLQAWEGGTPRIQPISTFGNPTVHLTVDPDDDIGWHRFSAIVAGQSSEPETFRVATADRRAFGGPDLTVEAGACSDSLDVFATDVSGTPLVVASPQLLAFGSDGTSLTFHGDAACTGSPPADIDPGQLSLSIRVTDPLTGVKNIWVGGPGDGSALQDNRKVTVTPAAADKIEISSSTPTAAACETATTELLLRDRFGNCLVGRAEGEAVVLSLSPAGVATFASSNLLGATGLDSETLIGAIGSGGHALVDVRSDQPGPVTVTASFPALPGVSASVELTFTEGGPSCRSEGPIGIAFAGGVQHAVAGQRIPFAVELTNNGDDPATELSVDFVCEGLRVLELGDHALREGDRRFLGDLGVGAASAPAGRALVEVGVRQATCRARALYQVGGVFLSSESAPWTVVVQGASGGGIACESSGPLSGSGSGLGLSGVFLLGVALLGRRRS